MLKIRLKIKRLCLKPIVDYFDIVMWMKLGYPLGLNKGWLLS